MIDISLTSLHTTPILQELTINTSSALILLDSFIVLYLGTIGEICVVGLFGVNVATIEAEISIIGDHLRHEIIIASLTKNSL